MWFSEHVAILPSFPIEFDSNIFFYPASKVQGLCHSLFLFVLSPGTSHVLSTPISMEGKDQVGVGFFAIVPY